MNTATRRKTPRRMKVEEFVAWAPDDRWELIDGEPRAMAPASATHGIIQARLASVLTRHLDARGTGCVAVTEPAIIPLVRSRSNMRVPELAVTCSAVEPGQIALPDPVLVIEILSPTNEPETWENVWTYVSIPSVQEVLVLRSATISADLLCRRPDGTWPEEPMQLGVNDTLHLQCIVLTVPLAELYRGTYLARDFIGPASASR
jgi:Uma2 family endonuclease